MRSWNAWYGYYAAKHHWRGRKIPAMTWQEAMTRFGSINWIWCNPLELVDVADIVKDVEFKVFNEPANNPNGRVVKPFVYQMENYSVNKLMNIIQFVGIYGAKK